jgi:hypothetical protein
VGGWFGDEGEGAGRGVPLLPGVRGLGPREIFLQIDVENMRFEAMFRQYLFISSLHIWNRNVNFNLPFSSKCIHEVDNIFRMTTFVKYTGTAGCALTISGGSRNFVWGQVISFLLPSFYPYPPFPSLSSV